MNRSFIHYFAVLYLFIFLSSCIRYHEIKGTKNFNSSDYKTAIKHFEKIYRKNSDKSVEMKLADAYFKNGQLDSSENFYKRIVSYKIVDPKSIYSYAIVLMNSGKINLAKENFITYLTSIPNDLSAILLKNACNSINDSDSEQEFANRFIKDSQINTFSLEEYINGNAFKPDHEVFSGIKIDEWTKQQYQNLLNGATNENGNWISSKMIFGDLNSRFQEGPAAFTADGQTVYFTRSNYCNKNQLENNLKIFKATFINGKWRNLEEFPFNSDNYSMGQVTLSKDENKLFFTSNMPGGFGGADIYSSTLINGVWSKPENLGSMINTPGNESFPYSDEEGNLFFTSDNIDSIDKLDVFITYNNGIRWVQPEKINYTLNKLKDNFGFTFDPTNISKIISSQNKNKGKTIVHEFTGNARLKGTEIPVEGMLIELTTGKTGEIIKLYSDNQGKFNFILSPDINYKIYFKPKESFYKTESISTKDLDNSTNFTADFEVDKIELNKSVPLGQITYSIDKWELTSQAKIELDKLIQVLKDNLTMNIEVDSYMDISGNDKYNKVLTEKRALAAIKYIISQGVDSSRLTYKGCGENEIINHCKTPENLCNEEQNSINRRIAFKVISF